MRHYLSVLLFATILNGLPQASLASNCNFRTQGFATLDDGTVLRALRCLVTQLDKLQRENAALKRRLAEVEALMTELPAPYSNVDGVVTVDPDRAIGTATFLLSARPTGGANALRLADDVLEEVCGAKGGCALTVAFRQIGLFNDAPKDSVLTGPCQFTFDPEDRAWALSEGCGTPGRSGVDGDRFADAAETSDPVIVASGGACLLSESEPGRGIADAGNLQRDQTRGFFLVAMPARQPDGIRRFQCELVLN